MARPRKNQEAIEARKREIEQLEREAAEAAEAEALVEIETLEPPSAPAAASKVRAVKITHDGVWTEHGGHALGEVVETEHHDLLVKRAMAEYV